MIRRTINAAKHHGGLVPIHALRCLIILIALLPGSLSAQVWKKGRSSLMKNDFKTAESQLTSALKVTKSKSEMADTYKYLGISQFMLGKKQAATQSFQKAKRLNPSINLTENEVVDESVIPLFRSVSSSQSTARTSPKAKAPGNRSGGPTSVSTQKSKRTILKVLCNVPAARISLDGISYGMAGQDIEVQPGTVVLEVESTGYKPKAIKVQLEPLTTSSVTVNLDKIPPKPAPLPVQKSIPLPGTGGAIASVGRTTSQATPLKTGSSKKNDVKNDLFGPDPGGNDSFAGLPMTPPPTTVIPPAAPAQPVMPQAGFAPQQMTPAPYGPQPYPQQQSFQFQPGYAAQPGYAVQPAYPVAPAFPTTPAYPVYPNYPQQPVYQQPMYQAPPYGAYAAPANPYGYAAPPPQYGSAQAADPYGGYLGPPPEAPLSSAPAIDTPESSNTGGMPPPPILPGDVPQKSKIKTAKLPADKCGDLIKILPFGAGQFCHGSTMKGIFFLGAEIGALYFYKTNNDTASSYQSKMNTILQERDAARADIPADEQEAYDADTADRESQGKAAIAKAKQNAQYSMIAFVGLWGAGAVDAYINVPPSKKSKKLRRKSPRIMHSYNLELEKAPLGTWAMSLPHDTTWDSNTLSQDYLLGYTPTVDKQNGLLKHSLTLGMMWEL